MRLIHPPLHSIHAMASGRTRNRSANSRNSSSNPSPSHSASNSSAHSRRASDEPVDAKDDARSPSKSRSRSRSSTLSPESTAEPIDIMHLWSPSELCAVMGQVAARKSFDPARLFNGSPRSAADTLPADLGSHTRADLAALLERAVSQLSAPGAPTWTPRRPGFVDVLGVLASESRALRKLDARYLEKVSAYNKQRADFDSVVRNKDLYSDMTKRANAQIAIEAERRNSGEAIKAVGEENANSIRRDIVEAALAKEVVEAELNTWRLNELETRRRLDRIRLKIAATRGEMVTPTVDALVRPPPRWMVESNVCESVTSAESNEEGDDADEAEPSVHSSQDAGTAQEAPNDGGDAEMLPVGDKRSVASVNAVEIAVSGVAQVDEEEEPSTDIDDIGFDEDAEATEIRLLKNRLDMYDNESRDWQSTLQAIKVQTGYVRKSVAFLEKEAARMARNSITGGSKMSAAGERRAGSTSASKAARARRASQMQLELPLSPAKVSRKSRKGTPKRSLTRYEEE